MRHGRSIRSVLVLLLVAAASLSGLAGAASPPDPDCSATPASMETLHSSTGISYVSCSPTADGATTVQYEVTSLPSVGSFSLDPASGSYSWTPPIDFVGTDSFDYKATDDAATPHVTTGSVTLTSTNNPPECSLVEIDLRPNQAAGRYFSCYDPDGEPLLYALGATLPAHGEVSNIGNDGSFTYTPDVNYVGTDTFEYSAFDGAADDTNVVNVSVNNNTPTCSVSPVVSTKANDPVDIYAFCTDNDFDDNPVTPVVVTGEEPEHGTLSAYDTSSGSWMYTPDNGFVGTDTFKFTVSDGYSTSETYTVSIEVTNQKPECYGEERTIRVGKPVTINFFCYDGDNDALTVTAVQPVNGTLGPVVPGEFGNYSVDFTPTAIGDASFKVQADDGISTSDLATFTIEVTQNHAPSCYADLTGVIHTKVDTVGSVPLYCDDVDPQDDTLTYSILQAPAPSEGTLAITDGEFGGKNVTFTPASGFTGFTDATVRVSDGELDTDLSRRIHVANTPFCSPAPTLQVRPGQSKQVQPYCSTPSDFAGTPNYVIITPPTKGTLSPSGTMSFDGPRTYTAQPGTSGADSYQMQITSDAGNGNVVTQPINITPDANEAPVCEDYPYNQKVFTGRDNTINVDYVCYDNDNDVMTPVKDSDPAHGTLIVSGTDLIYQPTAGYTGSDSFTFYVQDSRGAASDAVTFEVTVAPPEKPTCEPVNALNVRPTKSKSFFLDCSSPQDDPQTYTVAEQPASGTVVQDGPASSPEFIFTAGAESGTVSFKLKAINAVGESELVTVEVNVSPTANEAPFCYSNGGFPQTVAKNATTALDLEEMCSDPDGDPLKFVRVTQPLDATLGTVTPEGPATVLSFNALDKTGTTSFTYKAVDDQATPKESQVVSYSVTVAANLAPTCTPQPTLNIRPGQSKGVYMLCDSPLDEAITYEIVTPPQAGTLTGSFGPSRTYTAPNAEGPQSFTYRAVSASGPSPNYVQNINVDADANEAPDCFTNGTDDRQVVAGGRATQLALDDEDACYDTDNDPLAYAIAGNPLHGTAEVVSGQIKYTPQAGYIGPDQLSFTASDAYGGTSDPTTWYIDVVAPTPPTCQNGPALTVRPGQTREVQLICTDPTNDALVYKIVTQPTMGTLSPSGDSPDEYRDYTAGSEEGSDSFQYTASSVNGTATTVTRSITISSTANVAPNCFGNSGFEDTVAKNVQSTLDPFCDDEDGDVLTYTKLTDPLHGTVTDDGGVLKYTSTGDYTGPDQFTYSASDGHGGTSEVTTYYLNVVQPTGPTCSTPPAQSVRPGKTIPVFLNCHDVTGTAVTFEIVTQPEHGTLDPSENGTLAYRDYTADADAPTGDDSFSYRATNANGTSTTVVQTIAISPDANHAAHCDSQHAVQASKGVATTVAPDCHDIDDDALTPVKLTDPTHGTVTVENGVLKYTSASDYTGVDSFAMKVTDPGGLSSNTVTVTVTVIEGAVNAAPVCTSKDGGTKHDVPVEIGLDCEDDDGDAMTYSIVDPPAEAKGTATISGSKATFTPAAGFVGTATFTYKASDGKAFSNVVSVTVFVTNVIPSCFAVSAEVVKNTPKPIPLSCLNGDNDPLTLSIVDAPSHGTLGEISGGNVTYTPATDYVGADSFTYKASDGAQGGVSEKATVSLTVVETAANQPPACPATVNVSVAHNTAKAITVECTDADGQPLTMANVSNPEHGTLSDFNGLSVTFTPTAGYSGTDGFTFQADDGHGGRSSAVAVVLTIAAAPAVEPTATPTPSPTASPSPTPGPGPGPGNSEDALELRDAADTLLKKGSSNSKKLDPKKPVLDLGSIGPDQCPDGCAGGVVIQTPPTGLMARASAVKTIGKATFNVAKGGTARVKVKINAAGKKLLKKKAVKAKVTIAMRHPSGVTETVSKTLTLKVKKKKRR